MSKQLDVAFERLGEALVRVATGVRDAREAAECAVAGVRMVNASFLRRECRFTTEELEQLPQVQLPGRKTPLYQLSDVQAFLDGLKSNSRVL